MTAIFFQRGNTFTVGDSTSTVVHDLLPSGNYVLKYNPQAGYFLESADSFTAPSKVYGKTTPRASRILDTFMSRPAATGVLLVGEKGSGKTLLARQASIEAAKIGIPTIIINSDFCGDEFNTFIQNMHQRCIILFDEFEKVYSENEKQELILTLLDGVFPSQKLFILTVNSIWRIDDHLLNRPGRVFYRFDFDGIEKDFIREYCDDNLINKSHIDRVIGISQMFIAFNFDMLKAMVEEMNRYGESPDEVVEVLNVKPQFTEEYYYIDVSVNGIKIDRNRLSTKCWHGNPMDQFLINICWVDESGSAKNDTNPTPEKKRTMLEKKLLPNESSGYVNVNQSHIVSFSEGGKITLKPNENMIVTLTRRVSRTFNWRSF